MLKLRLFNRGPDTAKVETLYGAIVAQARMPALYRDCGVPDSLEGRFEMIVLHLVLVLERLSADAQQAAMGQKVFDRFCQDMDDHLREMAVGDLSVPKKMRRIADAFYGRLAVYRAALQADGEEALQACLLRNVFANASVPQSAERLAAYVRTAEAALSKQTGTQIAEGQLAWPPAETISFGTAAASKGTHG